MESIAKFEKVSYDQFKMDYIKTLGDCSDEFLKPIYDNIQLPKRATQGSAGYDFYSSIHKILPAGDRIIIPTGIRCKINNDWVLMCFPRSGLGFKYGMRLVNTTGIIDSDYFFSDNEGHIMAKIIADCDMEINQGDRFMQGVFIPYGITKDDDTTDVRNGGFGSSGK